MDLSLENSFSKIAYACSHERVEFSILEDHNTAKDKISIANERLVVAYSKPFSPDFLYDHNAVFCLLSLFLAMLKYYMRHAGLISECVEPRQEKGLSIHLNFNIDSSHLEFYWRSPYKNSGSASQ